MIRATILAAAIAAASPASAQVAPPPGPPKAAAAAIDFTQKLVSVTGKPMLQPGDNCKVGDTVGKDCQLAERTLGDVAVGALEATIDEDRNVDPKKKFERDEIARKIFGNKAAVLSPDDVAVIKERIGKVFGPPEVGATWPILDPTLAK